MARKYNKDLIKPNEENLPEILKQLSAKYREFKGSNINANLQTKSAHKWFLNQHTGLRNQKAGIRKDLFQSEFKRVTSPKIGKMYMYQYDPKHKDTLPIYDEFPLVFFFNQVTTLSGDVMLYGINLHYLRPQLRYEFFIQLMRLRTEKRYRKSTRLRLEWASIKAASQKYAKHTVHAYLVNHLKTPFLEIPASHWVHVAALPTAKWVKGSYRDAYRLKG